jgi:cell division septum initiation protein DivIVA
MNIILITAMLKVVVGNLLKAIVFTGLLLLAYYFLYVYPNLLAPNALHSAEKILTTYYNELLDNRLSYTALIQLDASSKNFEDERPVVINRLQTTNDEGMKALENPKELIRVNGAPGEVLKFIDNDLAEAYPNLLEKNRKLLQTQKELIKRLVAFDSILAKIFAYDPIIDLGGLDPKKDKEWLLERVASAKNGIQKIQDNIRTSGEKNSGVENLLVEADQTQARLSELETCVKGNANCDEIKTNLYNQYERLKKQALIAEQLIIKSEESVKLLTDQTNLIFEYEHWLRRINGFQQEI